MNIVTYQNQYTPWGEKKMTDDTVVMRSLATRNMADLECLAVSHGYRYVGLRAEDRREFMFARYVEKDDGFHIELPGDERWVDEWTSTSEYNATARCAEYWEKEPHARLSRLLRAYALVKRVQPKPVDEPNFAGAASAMGARLALLGTYSNGDQSIGLSLPVAGAANTLECKTYLAYRAMQCSLPDVYQIYFPQAGIWRRVSENMACGIHSAVAVAREHWNTLSIIAREVLLREAHKCDLAVTTRMKPRIGGPLKYDALEVPATTTAAAPKYTGLKDPDIRKPDSRPCREQGGPELWMKIFVEEFAGRLGENTRFKLIYDYSCGELLLDVRLDDFYWQVRVLHSSSCPRVFDVFVGSYGRFAIHRDGAK